MRTGVATVPLDYGRCPKWLFEGQWGEFLHLTMEKIDKLKKKEIIG